MKQTIRFAVGQREVSISVTSSARVKAPFVEGISTDVSANIAGVNAMRFHRKDVSQAVAFEIEVADWVEEAAEAISAEHHAQLDGSLAPAFIAEIIRKHMRGVRRARRLAERQARDRRRHAATGHQASSPHHQVPSS